MQRSGSQTLLAGGSSQKLQLRVTFKETKGILPAETEGKIPAIFEEMPFGRVFSQRNPLQVMGAPRKALRVIFLFLKVIFMLAAG